MNTDFGHRVLDSGFKISLKSPKYADNIHICNSERSEESNFY